MGIPYLKSGESILLTADRVSADSAMHDAMLTSQSLILINSHNARSEPRIIPFSTIRSVRGGKAATGEPVILLALAEQGAEETQVIILFSQEPGENRKQDRDLWLQKLIELSVSGKGETIHRVIPRETNSSGIHPSTRRWLAPDATPPHTGRMPEKEPVPALVISMDEPQPVPAISQEFSEDRVSAESPDTPAEEPGPAKGGAEEIRPEPDTVFAATQPASPPVSRSTPLPAVAETNGALASSIMAAVKSLTERSVQNEAKAASIRLTSPLPDMPVSPPEIEPEEEIVCLSPPDSPDSREHPLAFEAESPVIRTRSMLPEISVPSEPEVPVSAIPSVAEPDTQKPVDQPKPDRDLRKPGMATTQRPEKRANERKDPVLSPATDRSILVVAGAIVGIILLVIAIAFLPGIQSAKPAPEIVTPTIIPVTTTVAPETITPARITQDGVWVRVIYSGFFTGKAGNADHLQQVSGSGEKYLKTLSRDGIVSVSIEKTGNDGDELRVEIYRDGVLIASRSTTKPMGTVDLLIDPATGGAPGMTTVTREPAGAQIEYL